MICYSRRIMRTFILAWALIAAALAAQSPSPYHITHTYTLGGDGSWDYVVPDPPNHRVFIARQTRVMVVDEQSGKLLGEVHGDSEVVAVDQKGREGVPDHVPSWWNW